MNFSYATLVSAAIWWTIGNLAFAVVSIVVDGVDFCFGTLPFGRLNDFSAGM